MHEVCFVTCARLPDLDADDRLAIEPLLALDCQVTPAVWDDPPVDWDRFDVSVIRSTWDYPDRRDAFVRWARAVPRLLNPAAVVEWNTDKRYLRDLEAAGIPVVSTTWISTTEGAELPDEGEFVIKPAIGAGSLDAERYVLNDSATRSLARAHVKRLLERGQTVMLQPFVAAIDTAGETGVVFIDGELSHAIRKGPMLGAAARADVEGLYKEETIDSRTPTPAELDVARAAVKAATNVLPVREPFLYARVDLVAGADGEPLLMELELTEPSLFMATAAGSEVRFASAISRRAKHRGRARAPARRARPQQERMVS